MTIVQTAEPEIETDDLFNDDEEGFETQSDDGDFGLDDSDDDEDFT